MHRCTVTVCPELTGNFSSIREIFCAIAGDIRVPVRSFARVRPHMRGDRAALRESPVAHRTPERLFAGVRPRVRRQVRCLAERLRARVAPSRSKTRDREYFRY